MSLDTTLQPEKTSEKATVKKVVIVMPAYNVAKVLPDTIASLPKDCADEIIVVDDASTDGTPDVARELGLTVISHTQNRGYGGGSKDGLSGGHSAQCGYCRDGAWR